MIAGVHTLSEFCLIYLAAKYLFDCEYTRGDSQSIALFRPDPPVFLELSNWLLICSFPDIQAAETSSLFLGLYLSSLRWLLPLLWTKILMIWKTLNHYFTLLSITWCRVESEASDISVMPMGEGNLSLPIAIPWIPFRNILQKATHPIQKVSGAKKAPPTPFLSTEHSSVGMERLLFGVGQDLDRLLSFCGSDLWKCWLRYGCSPYKFFFYWISFGTRRILKLNQGHQKEINKT